MTSNPNSARLRRAWKKLIWAFLISLVLCAVAGFGLMEWFYVAPEKLLDLTTRRLAAAGAVFQKAIGLGLGLDLVLFVWNFAGAMATLSFVYTASWIDPRKTAEFPKSVRKSLVGKGRMKLLQFLPGCRDIEAEPVRRVYVWLMVPLLGILLLGAECGFIVSAAARLSGSWVAGIMSLVPHGIIEIPAIALAGAVPFSGHLMIKETVNRPGRETFSLGEVFDPIERLRKTLPIRTIALTVMLCLAIAAGIEAHVTVRVAELLAGANP